MPWGGVAESLSPRARLRASWQCMRLDRMHVLLLPSSLPAPHN